MEACTCPVVRGRIINVMAKLTIKVTHSARLTLRSGSRRIRRSRARIAEPLLSRRVQVSDEMAPMCLAGHASFRKGRTSDITVVFLSSGAVLVV
jgi:hypothetical protein